MAPAFKVIAMLKHITADTGLFEVAKYMQATTNNSKNASL